jgi:hypothetical protein
VSVRQILNFGLHISKLNERLSLHVLAFKPAGQNNAKDASFSQQFQEIYLLLPFFRLAGHFVRLRLAIIGEVKDNRF